MDLFVSDCERLRFPPEAVAALCAAREVIACAGTGAEPVLRAASEDLLEGSGEGYLERLAEVSALVPSVPRETLDMVFLISCLPELRARYRRKGLSEALFWATMEDLRFKLAECRRVRGVWGTFVTDWYDGFFRITRFAIGRLQYERRKVPFDAPCLAKGSEACACHIPSSGPLTPESVDASLRAARDFFPDVRAGGAFPVICHSWLLYPPVVALFPERSNLALFAARFQIFHTEIDPENKDAWRVFDRPFDPAGVGQLPADTALRRSLKAYLASGNCMGSGYGFLLVP